MKKFIVIILSAAVLGTGGYYGWKYLSEDNQENKNTIYVTNVQSLLETVSGKQNRYAGVVEPQETVKVNLENGRKVQTLNVKVGQEVKPGDLLFEYDQSSMQDDLEEKQLEYDELINEGKTLEEQIAVYTKEQAKADKDQQLSYTIQIETAKMSLKKNEYNQKTKFAEIEKLKASMTDTKVTSTMNGVIQKINTSKMNGDDSSDQSDSLSMDSSGNNDSDAFITILSTGAYRIKGKVNEQNYQSLVTGMPVIIRSRVNEEQIWHGTMGGIDTEASKDNSDSGYFGFGMSSDSQTTSSNYNFYVELDSSEELMLGQHVYIEMDEGQGQKEEGIWLYDYYIVDIDTKPYVWGVKKGGDTLEKIYIALGEININTGKYQIAKGLEEEDSIAFPTYGMEEGMPIIVTDDLRKLQENIIYTEDMGEDSYVDMGVSSMGTLPMTDDLSEDAFGMTDDFSEDDFEMIDDFDTDFDTMEEYPIDDQTMDSFSDEYETMEDFLGDAEMIEEFPEEDSSMDGTDDFGPIDDFPQTEEVG